MEENSDEYDPVQNGCANAQLLLPQQAKSSRQKLFNELITKKKIPRHGFDDLTIEYFLNEIALMDSNNFLNHVGVGEREGRVYSGIVRRRHMNLSHGIGRSGNINAAQPKAAGSSLINKLANSFALHSIRICGIKNTKAAFVIPCSTGMAMTLCLLRFRSLKPSAMYVIWSRIDHKSCIKCITTAGFQPVVVELRKNPKDDSLFTNVSQIENDLKTIGVENIACVITTTSCFAPRVPDNVIAVANLCKKYMVFHLVNNAYGLQCDSICNKIEEASRIGRIDAFVQSTDKNFLVPVGGSIIAGFEAKFVDSIAECYPGRASCTASLDFVISLLSMGTEKYMELRQSRKQAYSIFKSKLHDLAVKFNERIINCSDNTISLAMSLSTFDTLLLPQQISALGSMLFTRQCSGARVVVKSQSEVIENMVFDGWLSHCPDYSSSYLNVAAAIGIEISEINRFISILDDCLTKICKKINCSVKV